MTSQIRKPYHTFENGYVAYTSEEYRRERIRTTQEKQRLIGIQPPAEWPVNHYLVFLRDQQYSAQVTPEQRAALSENSTENSAIVRIRASEIQTPSPLVQIRGIGNRDHPAWGERGLFATQDLAPNQFICLYLGKVHQNTEEDTDDSSDYDLGFDRELDLSIDACDMGNESRFINDYRNHPDTHRANACFENCMIQVPSEKRQGRMRWERRMGVFVVSAGKARKRTRGIKQGEEILVSYGQRYWLARERDEDGDWMHDEDDVRLLEKHFPSPGVSTSEEEETSDGEGTSDGEESSEEEETSGREE